MKYRLRVDFIASDEKTCRRIFDLARLLSKMMVTISRGEPNEERSYVELERCYHDEEPTKPCEVIERLESE